MAKPIELLTLLKQKHAQIGGMIASLGKTAKKFSQEARVFTEAKARHQEAGTQLLAAEAQLAHNRNHAAQGLMESAAVHHKKIISMIGNSETNPVDVDGSLNVALEIRRNSQKDK